MIELSEGSGTPIFKAAGEGAKDRSKQPNFATDRIEDRIQNFPNTTLECYLLNRVFCFPVK
jgi:hypothetical protein